MSRIIAKTLAGLEHVLSQEIQWLGGKEIKILRRGVEFTGNKYLLYKSNLYLRTAIRILYPIFSLKVHSDQELYRAIKNFEWEQYMSLYTTFAIDSVLFSKYFKHSKYISLKAKDAIVDRFRDKYNQRPSIDLNDPDIYINMHIADNLLTVSLDSSGEPLFKRGYRKRGYLAPLNEVLAAGMILLSGWDKQSNFIDPMCGSGTLPIEAAMIAYNIPPGYFRKRYGYQRWKDYEKDIEFDIREKIHINNDLKIAIEGSDMAIEAIEIAKANSSLPVIKSRINWKNLPIDEYIPPASTGVVIINPPYGERISNVDLTHLYNQIGANLKHKYTGYNAWLISPNKELLKNVGLTVSKKVKLVNGTLECEFCNYKMYQGSKKRAN